MEKKDHQENAYNKSEYNKSTDKIEQTKGKRVKNWNACNIVLSQQVLYLQFTTKVHSAW